MNNETEVSKIKVIAWIVGWIAIVFLVAIGIVTVVSWYSSSHSTPPLAETQRPREPMELEISFDGEVFQLLVTNGNPRWVVGDGGRLDRIYDVAYTWKPETIPGSVKFMIP